MDSDFPAVLGLDWLTQHNLLIDWVDQSVTFRVCPDSILISVSAMAPSITDVPDISESVSVKLGVQTETSGLKSCKALASTCRLRRSLAGCLEFRRSGQSRRVGSRAEKKLKKTRAS